MSTVPQVLSELIQVLTSDYMGLTLSNMTGLGLHSSVPKSKNNHEDELDDNFDDEDDDEEDDEDDGDEFEEANSNEDEESSSNDDEEEPKSSKGASSNALKRKNDDSDSNKASDNESDDDCQDKPCTSSSMTQSENLYKKFKTTHQVEDIKENSAEVPLHETAVSSSAKSNVEYSKPKCYFEVRRWKQGAYTLITDDDAEIKTKALDLMVFFKCKQWSLDCGGNVSYIARDEDNEVSHI